MSDRYLAAVATNPAQASGWESEERSYQAESALECPSQIVVPAPAFSDQSCNEQAVEQNGTPVPPRRLFGVYYTPDDLAMVLTQWALRRTEGSVLDPSFGGCAFLTAAARVLRKKGIEDPGRLIWGIDVDATCVESVRRSDDLRVDNCIAEDFLQLRPDGVDGAPFAAIVGNPPFIRHHWLKGSTRRAARSIASASAVSLPSTANAWAYFLLHCFDFLKKEGRLAMLVPEAILQADYAISIREALARRFRRVRLIHLRDRLFEGTDEPVVVVAASGRGHTGPVVTESVASAEDLQRALNGAPERRRSARTTLANGRTIATSTLKLVARLEQHHSVRRLADLATVRIGFVTGANAHFIRSLEDIEALEVPNEAQLPVVARTKWLSGLTFREDDHTSVVAAGRRAILVRPAPELDDHEGIRRWIAEGVAAGLNERYKCSRRIDWFRMQLPQTPDAFATCTRLGAPLVVINDGGFNCSNALHSIRWKSSQESVPRQVALGFLTSLVRLWAELHGRRYGGGVLKLEPSTLNRTPIPLVPIPRSLFDELDLLIRAGNEEEARRRADEAILFEGMQLQRSEIQRLWKAADLLSLQRRPNPRKKGARS